MYLKYGNNCITNNGDIKKVIFPILLLVVVVVLFSLEPCISKMVNSSNLKRYTQVGFHDRICSHRLTFLYIV